MLFRSAKKDEIEARTRAEEAKRQSAEEERIRAEKEDYEARKRADDANRQKFDQEKIRVEKETEERNARVAAEGSA